MGDLEAQSTKSQSWSFQLFSIVILLLLAMSALTVYVAIKNSQNAQKIEDLQNLYLADHFEPEEDDDVIVTKQTIRSARSADGSGEVCSSEFNSSLNVTPSAHLVGSDSMNPDDNTNDGVLVTWRCNVTNAAHVIGGMKTNRAGELTVPISGIYYIYLQLRVMIRVTNSHASSKKLGHKIRIRRIVWNSVLERYESLDYDDNSSYETTDYYGGLHYLEKGDTIAVAIQNPCPNQSYCSGTTPICSIEVFRARHAEKSNFFGAFLVTPATENMVPSTKA